MISFACDYLEGCHEKILEALIRENHTQVPGYGADPFTASAKEKIRNACGTDVADVYFVNGGTQVNLIAIDTMLAPYEGVLAADTGHINVHEAGAIEFSGHKVMTLPSENGKIRPEDAEAYVSAYYQDPSFEHMVFPGMIYISHPTEFGTLYTAEELKALAEVCSRYDMRLYLDGARLGYGLMADGTDVTLPLIASLTDAFSIGGTKVGALNGEALVFPRGNAPKHFLTRIKQHGALSAKGRLLGIQFDTLFTDELYFKIGRHGIEMAKQIRRLFEEAGFSFLIDSPTNQQFVVVENQLLESLEERIGFEVWCPVDEEHTAVRFAASWSTTPDHIEELRKVLSEL